MPRPENKTTGDQTRSQRLGTLNSPRTEPSFETAEKRKKIVELRRHRLSWAEIGKSLGIAAATAHNMYREALAAIPAQSVDEHRAEETQLIDDATADLMIIARDPEVSPRTRVEAWSSIRTWAERKAKLLGLDAPQQMITVDLVDQEIARLTAEVEKMEAAVQAAPVGHGIDMDAPMGGPATPDA